MCVLPRVAGARRISSGPMREVNNAFGSVSMPSRLTQIQPSVPSKRTPPVLTSRSPLRDLSPWPMVVTLADGSAWDTIGKAYKRLELGDSEYLPAFFQWAEQTRRGGARG